MVLERIEKNRDVVVGEDVPAARQVLAQQARMAVEAEKDVKGGRRIAEVNLGLFRSELPLVGVRLHKVRNYGEVILHGFGGPHAFKAS